GPLREHIWSARHAQHLHTRSLGRIQATLPPGEGETARRRRAGSRVDDLQPDALVALALALRLDHTDPADLAGRMNVRATVGLLVEADDVHHTDLRDGLGNHRDFGADEILVHHRSRTGKERHFDGAVGSQLVVDELFHTRPEALGQWIELEVHTSAQWFHVTSGHT